MCIEFRVPAQGLSKPLVVILQNRWKRLEQMNCENGSLRLRKIKCQLLDFVDGGHEAIVIAPARRASTRSRLKPLFLPVRM